MHSWQVDEFWQFSLRQYPQCQSLYLHLQDRWGLNVNMLLLCQYVESLGHRLNAEHIQQLCTAMQQSEQELTKHRNKRQRAKDTPNYPSLLSQELMLEQHQQGLLLKQLNLFSMDQQFPVHSVLSYARYKMVAPQAVAPLMAKTG